MYTKVITEILYGSETCFMNLRKVNELLLSENTVHKQMFDSRMMNEANSFGHYMTWNFVIHTGNEILL
jgi:hypothetical protein